MHRRTASRLCSAVATGMMLRLLRWGVKRGSARGETLPSSFFLNPVYFPIHVRLDPCDCNTRHVLPPPDRSCVCVTHTIGASNNKTH